MDGRGEGRSGGTGDEGRPGPLLRWVLATVVAAAISFAVVVVVLHGGGDPTAAVASPSLQCAPARPLPDGSLRVIDGTVSIGDGQRTYRLTLPPAYDGVRPVPMVVLLHGTSGTVADIEAYTGFPAAAAQRGYAVLTPQALAPADGTLPIHWTVPGFDGPGSPDDVAFVSGLIDTATTAYCVDSGRVFATGISGGAAFATVMACQTDLLAGIAPVAGFNLVPPCANARPLSVLAVHGTADALVAYAGLQVPLTGSESPSPEAEVSETPTSESPSPESPSETASPTSAADLAAQGGSPFYNGSVVDDTARWAAAFGCATTAAAQPAPDVSEASFTGCRDNVTVSLLTVAEGGHVWPGGTVVPEGLGFQTESISATTLILDAFDSAPGNGLPVRQIGS